MTGSSNSNKINYELLTLLNAADVARTRNGFKQGSVTSIVDSFSSPYDLLETTYYFPSSEKCNGSKINITEEAMVKGRDFESFLWKTLKEEKISKDDPYYDAANTAKKLLKQQHLELLQNNVSIRHRTPTHHNKFDWISGEIDAVMHDTSKNELALLEVKMTNGNFKLRSQWFLQLALYALATKRALTTSRTQAELPDAYLLVFEHSQLFSSIHLLKVDWKRVAQLVFDKVPLKFQPFFIGLPSIMNCVQVISKSLNKKLYSQKFDKDKKRLLMIPHNINYSNQKEVNTTTEPYSANPVEAVIWKSYFPYGVLLHLMDIQTGEVEDLGTFEDVRVELINEYENEVPKNTTETTSTSTPDPVSISTPIPVYVQTVHRWKATFNSAAEIYRRQKDPKKVAFAVLFESSNISTEQALSMTEKIIMAVELLSGRNWIQENLVVDGISKDTLCKIKGNPSFVIL